jgi:hypothetical protein
MLQNAKIKPEALRRAPDSYVPPLPRLSEIQSLTRSEESHLDNFSFARIPEIRRGLLARARSEKLRHSFASFNEEIDIVHVANIHDCPNPRFGHPILVKRGNQDAAGGFPAPPLTLLSAPGSAARSCPFVGLVSATRFGTSRPGAD